MASALAATKILKESSLDSAGKWTIRVNYNYHPQFPVFDLVEAPPLVKAVGTTSVEMLTS